MTKKEPEKEEDKGFHLPHWSRHSDPVEQVVEVAQEPVAEPVAEPAQETPPDVEQEPAASEETQPLVTVEAPVSVHPELDIATFANKIQDLADHAHLQSQVESEFKSRWEWWKNKLGEFHQEVNSHAKRD